METKRIFLFRGWLLGTLMCIPFWALVLTYLWIR